MTDKERAAIRKALQDQTKIHKASPDVARAFLLRSGVYTSKGELATEYGGADSTQPANKQATS